MVKLEKHERVGIGGGERGHPHPQRAEQLARRRRRREVVEHDVREVLLLLAVDRVDQRFLRFEVAIDRPGTDAGAVGDLGHRGTEEAALHEQRERRIEDRLPLVRHDPAGAEVLLARPARPGELGGLRGAGRGRHRRKE
jgi:hypothetical protein